MEENNNYGQGNVNNTQQMNYSQNVGQQGYQQSYQQGYQQSYQQGYQQPYQQGYQQPYQSSYNQDGLEEPVSVGEWMISYLVMLIPCVNIVMIFVWAFGSGTKKSKSNMFKASLIWAAISIVVAIVFMIAITSVVGTSFLYY